MNTVRQHKEPVSRVLQQSPGKRTPQFRVRDNRKKIGVQEKIMQNISIFSSMNSGTQFKRASIDDRNVETFKKHTLQSVFSEKPITELPPVGIVYYYAGAKPDILTMMAQNHRGIVIIGSGSGNYSQAWLNEIETLGAQGIIFVRASRVNQGIVYESDVFDPHNVCIPSNTLSGQKARVLLMLALSVTQNTKEIKRIFNEY